MSEVTEKRDRANRCLAGCRARSAHGRMAEGRQLQNRSEFINKALRFYMGYLGTEDNTAYLSRLS